MSGHERYRSCNNNYPYEKRVQRPKGCPGPPPSGMQNQRRTKKQHFLAEPAAPKKLIVFAPNSAAHQHAFKLV